MRREFFGYNEKVWSDEEWDEIAAQMKSSPWTRVRYLRMIFEGEHQGARFHRIAFASGWFFFFALMKFPVIRIQPGFKRVGISAALASSIYYWVHSIGDEMKYKRIKYAYRCQWIKMQGNHRVTI